jgi:hypothetical protein
MAKRKKTISSEYKRKRRQLIKKVEGIESRGFFFGEQVIPKEPKKPTKASIRAIERISKNIYKKARYVDTSTGQLMTGEQGREHERSMAGKRAALTRRIYSDPRQVKSAEEEEFERARREQDKADSQLALSESSLQEGEMVLQGIYNMIDSVGRRKSKAAEHLRSVLDREITTRGRDNVARALAGNASEAIEAAAVAINYGEGDGRHDAAVQELQRIITGQIPSAQEMREMQDELDAEEYEDGW